MSNSIEQFVPTRFYVLLSREVSMYLILVFQIFSAAVEPETFGKQNFRVSTNATVQLDVDSTLDKFIAFGLL